MSKYEVGSIVTGNVTGIEKYGIFVGLDEFYSGLIHISEISSGFVRDINDFVKIGETIKVKIVEVDDENCRLKLSIKDFDYHMVKRNRCKIIETKEGFNPLKNSLNYWIEMKMEEIQEKK